MERLARNMGNLSEWGNMLPVVCFFNEPALLISHYLSRPKNKICVFRVSLNLPYFFALKNAYPNIFMVILA